MLLHRSSLLPAAVLASAALLFWALIPVPDEKSPVQPREATEVKKQAQAAVKLRSLEDTPPQMQQVLRARRSARQRISPASSSSALEAFDMWMVDYLHAPAAEKPKKIEQGVQLARERRVELKSLIVSDARAALEQAVPPVIRQELPMEVAQELEERVNENAELLVLGRLPGSNAAPASAYVREVRTQDGGVYEVHTSGDRLTQRSTARMSVLGIAVDGVLALEERPLRVMEAGEIPNHPNNLTRRRTLRPVDAQGFAMEELIANSPAPPRDIVDTCPISGISTPVKPSGPGFLAPPVAPEQPVVEAAGRVHYLCSGGHIRAFEDELLVREGGNGGPVLVSEPPTPTQSTGHRRNLLMRVAFPENRRGLVNEADAHTMMRGVQDWMLSTSAGRLTFSTTITPLLILPRTEAWYIARDTSGSANDVLIDARAAAKLAGFDPDAYEFDTVIYTGTPGNFGGQASLGSKGCWLKSTSVQVACHEYGHNFGLMHANAWNTANGTVIGGGTHSEYGDSFDSMGITSTTDAEFNAAFKNMLGWMPDAYVHNGSSGTYRIHAMDVPGQDTRLRYALKIRKDVDRDYWIDLRQKFSTNFGVQNGVFVHWSPWLTSQGGTHLLDTVQYEAAGINDAPLLIGTTLSDPGVDVHITPVAKYATSPPSMDVVVNTGSFPGNQPPAVVVTAGSSSAAVNAAITFTASAVDPNGDTLSYAWDFDQDAAGVQLRGNVNAPTVSYSWVSAGIYRVRCVVSDMKGGRASSSVVVQIGTPSPALVRVSGTVTQNGQPVADAFVSNGSTTVPRSTRTDSDGTYSLHMVAGNYVFSAKAAGMTVVEASAGLGNVTVGSTAVTGINFVATELPQVSITALDDLATEGGDTATLRLSRTGSTASALTVSFFAPSGTAVKGTDYTFTPDTGTSGNYRTFSIPSNQSTLDVTVTALTDAAVESFERLTLEMVSSGVYLSSAGVASVNLADANSTQSLVQLVLDDRDATEGTDAAQFTILRQGDTMNALDVQLLLSGTGVSGTDYAGVSTTMTIPGGSSTLVVPVTIPQDVLSEPMKTLVIEIATDAAYVRSSSLAQRRVSLNLHDDDAPVLSVTASDATASEAGNDTGVFTITRTGSTADPLLVRYGLGGSALHGVDYGVLPGQVTIEAGHSMSTVVVVPEQDDIGEAAQTATLYLRSDTAYVVGTAATATVTINDDDLPYVTVQTTTGAAVEGGASAVFRITNTASGSGNITVNYAMSGTATNGTDYTTLSGTVTIARNSFVDVSVVPIQDADVEGFETVTLTLTPSASYSRALDSSSTVNLQDDERPQVHVSTYNNGTYETQNQNIGFYLTRTGSTTAALTVNYTLSGSMTPGVDYSTPSGTFTIPANSVGAYCTFTVFGDTLAEGTETLTLTLSPGSTYSVGIGSATTFMTDAQNASVSDVLSFGSASSSAAENAGVVSIPVVLAAASTNTITVFYEVTSGTATGAGIDYTPVMGELVFAPGDLVKNILLPVRDDTLDETDETVTLSLSRVTAGRAVTPSTHTLTILDNDDPVPVTFGFASATSSVNEGAGSAVLPVALSTAQTSSVSVNFAITGGSATNGTDYTITSGTLSFAPGETLKLIPINVVDDTPVESNETVILTLSAPVGGTLTQTTHTLTITDNDTITVSLSATDTSASEPGTNTGTWTLSRTGPSGSALTVNLTRGGTATNGTDYASLATTATLAANSTQTLITLTPLDDSTREGNETVSLTLASGTGYVIAAPTGGSVTIQDNEPIVSITATDSLADEGGDGGVFTVSRTDASTAAAITVNVSLSGTATSGSDYSAITLPITIPAAQSSVSFAVTPVNDTAPEPSETVIATITAGGYAISGLSSATVTITDDEPFVSVAASDAFAREGGETGAFTITRTGNTAAALDVFFTLSGTAVDGTDFATIASPVSIPPGQASVEVILTTLQDTAQESYETATLTLSTNAAYTLGGATVASLSIQDDDVNNPPVITVTSPTTNNVALPSTAVGLNVVATAVDDGGPPTCTWSTVYSPAGSTATFDNAAAAATGVRFSAAGTYHLRLTASDGSLPAAYDLRVTVAPTITGAVTSGDIGSAVVAGAHTIAGDTITISGSGAGISQGSTSDGVYFLRQATTGVNVEVIAYCGSVTGGASANGRAGIMLRNGTGAGEVLAFIGLTNNSRATWSTRVTTGGTTSVSHTNNIGTPRWLRISRTSTSFSGYRPDDGVTWTQVGTTTNIANANTDMLAGLAVTGAGSTATTAVFSRVGLSFTSNRGPVIDAGTNRSGRVGTIIAATGTKSDDALPLVPGTVSTQWLRMSGPGNVTISDTGSLAGSFLYDQPGTHVMRLIGNDGQVQTFDEMTVTATQDVVSIYTMPGLEVGNESGPGEFGFEIARTGGTHQIDIPVTIGGTATPVTDYQWFGYTFTLYPGDLGGFGTLNPVLDALVEGTETGSINMQPGPGYALNPTATSANFSILDAPVVTLTPSTPVAHENGLTPGVFTLSHNGPTTSAYTVTLSASGTATPDVDYSLLPATITIPSGQNSITLPVSPLADFLLEPDELITLTGTGNLLFAVGSPATITLRDAVQITVARMNDAAEIGAVAGSFLLTRVGSPDLPLPVNIGLSGTASNGTDYTALPASVIIPAGETTLAVPVAPLSDSMAEGLEDVTLTVLPGLDYMPGAPAADTLTISDLLRDQWRFNTFGTDANNPLIAGDTADPDRDGLPNLLEYALGRLPLTAESPSLRVVHDFSGVQQRLTLTRDPAATDVLIQVKRSATLQSGSWTTNALQIDQNTPTTLQVRDTTARAPGVRSFLRIEATPAP